MGTVKLTFGEWCEKYQKDIYIKQWDMEMNGGYTPDSLSYGSTKKIHWKCEKGHRWVVSVNNRTSVKDSNCPYCSGKKLLKGENDLQTLYPDIAKEWDWKLNGNKPSDYFGNSNYKVHWVCAKGHKYEAKINDRTKSKGTGCPYCAGNKVLVGFNDLQTLFPELEKEWDYEKNNRDIETISAHSGYKAWWICANNHSYLAKVNDRTKSKGTGCPYCANRKVLIGYNDLFTTEPQLKAEWNYDRNLEYSPTKLTAGSSKKVWWKCKYGHEWQANIYSRASGCSCPFCAGEKTIIGENDLQTVYPEIAREWNYNKNELIKPFEIMPNSGKEYWWKCKRGHEWMATPNNRVSLHTGCPVCSQELHTSFPEQAILYYISKYEDVINRYVIEKNEVDIYLPDYHIGIEYDGIFYHSSLEAKERELRKDEYLHKADIVLIRVKEAEQDIQDQKNIIYRNLKRKDIGLENVIYKIFAKISKINGKKYEPDIDIHRDKQEIWAKYINLAKSNSLLRKYPDLAREWGYEKNNMILPEQVSVGSHKKVWWKCKQGHEWEAEIKSRVNGEGCPYCANKKVLEGYNDLQTFFPELAKEWDYNKNKKIPSQYTRFSNKKVWWRCKQGHEWEAVISKRTLGRGCPYCSNRRILKGYNDLQTKFPLVAERWDSQKNGIEANQVFPFSNKKAWWKCSCGCEWEAVINYMSRKNICPRCGKTN